jgi:hypothetical protein
MKLALACLLILALAILPACTQPAEVPPDITPPTPTQEETETPSLSEPTPTNPTEEEAETPPSATNEESITEEDIEAARQVVFAYWEAFNNYDVDGVLAFLEESWQEDSADDIASEIDQMKGANMTMGVEEEAEPTVTTDGTIVIKMLIDIPIMIMPDRHYSYYLKKIDGEWKIYYAEEVEK